MNGLKKFFGKDDIQVFESGRKSAEQAKQQEKARKPKSSRWKKYLAVGASLAILGFATPLGAEKEGLANDFQGNPLKTNTIEMTSDIASGNSSTLLAMNDVSGNSDQTIQDDNPLTKEQKKELKKLYKKQANEAYMVMVTAVTKDNIIIDEDILEKRYKDELAKAEEKNSNLTEKAKKNIRTDVSTAMQYEVAYTLWFASHSKTGCAMAKTALDKGWKFGLMPEKLQEARPGAAATTDTKQKIIYVKSIADRKAYLEKEENKDKRKPYDKLEKEDFKDDVTELSDLEKNIRAAQVWDVSHELRHAWQYENGIGLEYSKGNVEEKPVMTIPEMEKDGKNSYNVKSLINIHRTMEADAETHAVLVAWELNELMKLEGEGQFDLSRTFKLQKASDNRKVMPEAFEEVIAGDKMAITDDEKVAAAASATFKAWHEVKTEDTEKNKFPLKNRYDAQIISKFDTTDMGDRLEEAQKLLLRAWKEKDYDVFLDNILFVLTKSEFIERDWNFNRAFNKDKFARSFKLARENKPYISDAAEKDFYFKGLGKEENVFLDKWFIQRRDETNKQEDKSYNYKPEGISSNFNKKSQEKHARTQYNNKVAVALKARKNARG